MYDAGREVRAGLSRWKAPSGWPRCRSFKELAGGGGLPCGCVRSPSPPLPAAASKPRRAERARCESPAGLAAELGMLSGQHPLEQRVRKRWLLRVRPPGSGPAWALCARSCSLRCLLAGPPDPRCRLACPVSAFNLAARPEEGRGGAGGRRGGRARPGGGGGGCWESRGGGGWGRCGVTGVGSPRWLREANREVRGPRGRRGEDQPRPGSSGDSGAGPGRSGRR